MTRRTYRYRGRWNRRAKNLAKLRGVKLAPVELTNSMRCRDSKRRYSWVTVGSAAMARFAPLIGAVAHAIGVPS